jgi:hypothetical protein
MSVDILGVFNDASNIVISAILILGIYRAQQMRKAFVTPAYRSRATWSAILMLIILIVFVSSYVPVPSVFGFLPFFSVLLAVFAYADKSVLVAIETDFFHRNTLGWLRVRRPAGVVFVAFMAVVVAVGELFSLGNQASVPPFWGAVAYYSFTVAAVVVLAYSAAALIVGARRSSDRTLRRSISLFGYALSTLVLSLVLTSPLDQGSLAYVIINQGTALVGIYLIYRSVMSLSPLGRVEKEVALASKLGERGVALPSHP